MRMRVLSQLFVNTNSKQGNISGLLTKLVRSRWPQYILAKWPRLPLRPSTHKQRTKAISSNLDRTSLVYKRYNSIFFSWMFVLGHYLFFEARSFLRATTSETCSVLATGYVRCEIKYPPTNISVLNGGYCLFVVHNQIFLILTRESIHTQRDTTSPYSSPLSFLPFWLA